MNIYLILSKTSYTGGRLSNNMKEKYLSKTSYTGGRLSNNMKEKYVYFMCFETPVQQMRSILKNVTP